jgi:hypothetical protein
MGAIVRPSSRALNFDARGRYGLPVLCVVLKHQLFITPQRSLSQDRSILKALICLNAQFTLFQGPSEILLKSGCLVSASPFEF